MAAQAACPGLLHIVDAVDGGLCRIKLAGGRLDARQARAVAQAARAYASGVIEITNRANLQLRGVRKAAARHLIDALTAAGMGPLAAPDETTRQARDRRRNVMISPTAGIDPAMRLDTTRLADALLEAMQRDARLDGLSPKFAILLDGGEGLADLGHPHDIWLRADTTGMARAQLLLGLAGAADRPAPDHCLGHVHPGDAVATVMALLRAFVELAGPNHTRMRQLLAESGGQALLIRARGYGARISPLQAMPSLPPTVSHSAMARAAGRLGAHPQHQTGRFFVGFHVPLARLDADCLDSLASLAERLGDGGVRLTPWQGGLLTGLAAEALAPCLQGLRQLGLVTAPEGAIVRLQACAGRTGCARTQADTKHDAQYLAARPLPDAIIHLSGCPRSCAAATPADFTLLASTVGHYDLHRRDGTPGPGRRIACGLTIEQAAGALQAFGAEAHDV